MCQPMFCAPHQNRCGVGRPYYVLYPVTDVTDSLFYMSEIKKYIIPIGYRILLGISTPNTA